MELLILIAVAVVFVWGWWRFVMSKATIKSIDNAVSGPKDEPAPQLTPAQVEKNYDAGLSQLGLPSAAELRKLTKKQMDDQAAKQGIKLDARQTKEKMIKAYRDALKQK